MLNNGPTQQKHKFPYDKINEENILKFIDDFEKGKLKNHVKTQDVIDNTNEAVKQIVGSNFEDLVIKTSKDVLVFYYAPWCGHCKNLKPIYDDLAKKLSNNRNLVLAKMDLTTNEVEGLQIQGYPTLKFYTVSTKRNPIDMEGEKSEASLIDFLKKNSDHPWVQPKV